MNTHHSKTRYNWFDELVTIKKAYAVEDRKSKEIKGYIQQLNKESFAVYMYTEKGNCFAELIVVLLFSIEIKLLYM